MTKYKVSAEFDVFPPHREIAGVTGVYDSWREARAALPKGARSADLAADDPMADRFRLPRKGVVFLIRPVEPLE